MTYALRISLWDFHPSKSLLLVILFALIFNLSLCTEALLPWRGTPYTAIVKSLDFDRINTHLKELTGYGRSTWSRVTGYEGNIYAQHYILNEFKKHLQDVREEFFEVTVPVDQGASIIVFSTNGSVLKEIKAHPLWPNIVNPCPYESTQIDKLIYIGNSTLEEFDGKEIDCSFVLTEFNIRWFWKNAALFGAKGIIFIEPDDTTRIEASQKTFGIPLNFPRLYISKEDGIYLRDLCEREGSVPIRIRSMMEWESVLTANIIGYVYGTDFKDNEIVVAAHYDSWSPVPSLSPGATDALGIASLLELARVFSNIPPRRTVIFVALSAHWQGLWGAREFVDKHFDEIGSKIKLFIDLDLSTDSEDLAIYHQGASYPYLLQPIAPRYNWLRVKATNELRFAIETSLNKKYKFFDGIQQLQPLFEPMPLMFDSEPFTSACYGGGISLHTTNALRIYQQTPLDTYERLKLNNLQPQLEFIACLLHGLADLDSIPNDVAYPATRFGPTDWGFASLKAIICRYNVTSAWYDPFPHPDAVVRIVFGQPGSVIDFVAKPNDDGVLVIKGVKPYVQGLIEAYIIDKRTGAIEYVSDLGYYAFGGTGVPDPSSPSPREYFPYREETVKYLSVFRTGSAALFNILNPSTLAHEGSVEVYNFLSHGPLIQYNIDIAWPEVMVYVEQNTPFEIIIRGIEKSPLGGFVYPFGVLVNSSLERPSGFGYIVHAGQTLILKNTPFLLLKDTIYLQSQRFSILSSFHASNERIEKYNSLSIHFLKQAEEALKAKRYSLAYACTLTSWSYAMRSYWSTMDLTFEVISTIVFFIFLLIPFSFLGERLLLFYGGLKRLISVMIIIIVSLMILYTLHPGFHISTNVPIIVISSSILIISIFVLILIFLVSKEASSEFSDQRLGIHTIKVSRGGLLSVALSTGIQNMRKRRFRTILTLTSLTIIVFATISFTSLSAITVLHRAELELSVPYNGILIRKRPWSPISEHLYLSLFERFKDGAHVLPRTWIIPPQQTLMLGPKAIAQAVLAVSPEEDILTNISKVLIHGRWFNQNEYRSCIISESLAKLLGADIGASLNFYGINISIVGIMDGNLLWNGLSGIIDLDKEAITPQNIMASATETGGMGAVVEVPHIVGDFVIIVPYKLALEYFNSLPYSIAIKFKDSSIVVPTAEELSLGVSTQIYAGLTSTNKVVIFRPTFGYMSIGTQFILAPIVIVALTIFNLMLGAIYERMRETSILSSLGLAPLHITGMFLAESVLYSILSAVLGYVIGNAAMSIMSAMKAIPEGFYPNYSSVFIIIITALCVLVVISSTAYPALKAGKLVTPSLETRWRLQTKPVGDEWSIPLPFIAFEEEVGAILAYLEEYFNAHGSAYGANFATLETALEEGSKTLRAKIWLAPFEMGIRQSVNIFAIPEAGTKYKFLIRIHKESGFRDTWITVNTRFIDLLRKQFLIWRSLQPSEKARYIQASSIKSKAG